MRVRTSYKLLGQWKFQFTKTVLSKRICPRGKNSMDEGRGSMGLLAW